MSYGRLTKISKRPSKYLDDADPNMKLNEMKKAEKDRRGCQSLKPVAKLFGERRKKEQCTVERHNMTGLTKYYEAKEDNENIIHCIDYCLISIIDRRRVCQTCTEHPKITINVVYRRYKLQLVQVAFSVWSENFDHSLDFVTN